MSDDLVKRLHKYAPDSLDGNLRGPALEAAASLLAKDAKIARLLEKQAKIIAAIHSADLWHDDGCGAAFDHKCTCGLDEVYEAIEPEDKEDAP